MRTKLLSTCLALLFLASSPNLFADSIAYFTAIQPLDLEPGPNHVDQIVTFSLPQGAPVQGGTDGSGNFLIRTTATVHIIDTTASGPPIHSADAVALLQFFNDGVNIGVGPLGFQFNQFTNAPLDHFFTGPVSSPTFVLGFYPSNVPTGGFSLTIADAPVPEPATIATVGTSLLGLLSLRRRRVRVS
jgi:PEP-CTERM putative exosortase interaction domain